MPDATVTSLRNDLRPLSLVRWLLFHEDMTRPRQVLREQFYMITRSCTQRQFLLRPDDETTNAFIYCLGEAAKRFDIIVVNTVAESNHHHTIIFDRFGRFPAFMEHFHKMVARCLNARWGRWENFWSSEEACVTHLLDRDAVMDELVYVAANPVKDFLVDRAWEWPGANGYRHLLQNKPMRARRPRHFFRDDGVMPEEVTLELTIPSSLGARDEVIEELRRRVEELERVTRDARLHSGRRIVGKRRVTEQSWRDSPTSIEPRRNLRPRFAGSVVVRVAALLGYKEFLAIYADARRAWKNGLRACFPPGTYWLAKFTPVSVAPHPE
jgi:REP element-mobilizing transposase RayT